MLGFTMLSYGSVKVLPSQFTALDPVQLLEPYGESSPMHLLWSFMGHSAPYTVFTGAAEVLGGVFLLWRRTTTLGALILIGVLSNVVMLNLCYDVPVKQYSAHLLLIAAILAAADARRLASVLLLQRPTTPALLRVPAKGRWENPLRIALKTLFIAAATSGVAVAGWENYQTWGGGAPRPPLWGAWEVESFARGGEEVPPLLTDDKRWRRFAVGKYHRSAVYPMDDHPTNYRTTVDEIGHTLTLAGWREGVAGGSFSYQQPDSDHLVVRGTWKDAPVEIRMRKMDGARLLLESRGFRVINEVPFNR